MEANQQERKKHTWKLIRKIEKKTHGNKLAKYKKNYPHEII